MVIPVRNFLRAGNRGGQSLPLNVFSCAPSPKIFAVKVNVDPGNAVWTSYGREALRVEVEPDFGWFSAIVAAFIPKLYAWFDPNDQLAFIGHQASRFYKGPPIMLVKSRPSPSNVSRSTN